MLETVVKAFIDIKTTESYNLKKKYPEIIHFVPILRQLMKWGKEKTYPGLPRFKTNWVTEEGRKGVFPFCEKTLNRYCRIFDYKDHLEGLPRLSHRIVDEIVKKVNRERRVEPRRDEEDGQGGDGEDAVRGEDGESAKKKRKTLHEHLEQLVATMNEGLNQVRDQLHALDDLNQLRD